MSSDIQSRTKILTQLQPAIQNIFPESAVLVQYEKPYLSGSGSIRLAFTLGKDKTEYSGGYALSEKKGYLK